MTTGIRLEPHPYEQGLPHAQDLGRFYAGIGRTAVRLDLMNDILGRSIGERLIEENPLLMPGNRRYRTIESALRLDDPVESNNAQFDAGVELGDAIVRAKTSPRDRMLLCLNSGFQVNKLDIGVRGLGNRHEQRIYSLNHYSRQVVVDSLEVDVPTMTMVAQIRDKIHELRDLDPMFALHYTPALTFAQAYLNRGTANLLLRSEEGTPQPEEARVAEVTQMAQDIIAAKRFGVKPAYIEASVGGSWIFYDGPLTYTQTGLNNTIGWSPVPAAVILYSSQTNFQDLRFRTVRSSDGEPSPFTTEEFNRTVQPIMYLYLQQDGRLTLDNNGLRDLRTELQDDAAYIETLAEITSCYFDLTRSVTQVRDSNVRNFTQLSGEERVHFDPVLDLLLPRHRYVTGQAEDGVEQVESEDIEEAEDNPRGRTVRRHEVTYHPRLLPPGYRPRPDAAAEAAEFGITLLPGETLVRRHMRGQKHDVPGHKFKTRNEA